jgi:hypothetical protein
MICPNCQKDQKVDEQNYGALYTCPSCQAVYFISFEGMPEFGDVNTEQFATSSTEQNLPELGSIEPLVPTNNLVDPISTDPLESSSQLDLNQLDANEKPDNPFDLQKNMSAMNSDLQFEAVLTQPSAFSDIAQEISDFGNTDTNLSGLSYDLIISGIDTQEAKSLFKEAIEDSKFAWDSYDILKSIKNGRVEIKKIAPVKAYLLAKRIQFLDIEKIWKQNESA